MVGAIETRSAPTLLGATHRAFAFYLGNPLSSIETRSAPTLLGATHRAFTFYLGNPISSIETRSLPSLTHVLPRIRPVGFPIYVVRVPAAPFASRRLPLRRTANIERPTSNAEHRICLP
jgi:hypothetical protein